MSITISKTAFATLDAAIQATILAAVNTSDAKPKSKIVEKPKQKGQMNAWTAYGKEVHATHAAEYATWKAEQAAAGAAVSKQTVPCFVSQWRDAHKDEYATFEAAWKEAHPKEAPSKDAASVAGSETSQKKKRGPKKLSEMTVEERAEHDTKVAERKAAKKSANSSDSEELAGEVIVPSVAAPNAVAAPAPKPKRVLTEEQKAKMKAGREAAAAKKAAEKPSPKVKDD